MTRYKTKGVPIGYPETWKYQGRWKEKKVGKGIWKIDFKATKGRKAAMGNLKPGTVIKWKINAIQYAKKTAAGRYQTRMIGTKKLIRIKPRTR